MRRNNWWLEKQESRNPIDASSSSNSAPTPAPTACSPGAAGLVTHNHQQQQSSPYSRLGDPGNHISKRGKKKNRSRGAKKTPRRRIEYLPQQMPVSASSVRLVGIHCIINLVTSYITSDAR
jgi:hypothetical protein